ncbi:MAG TPA: DUF1835 domain-containing protein [Sphingobacteriaceae bacterium]
MKALLNILNGDATLHLFNQTTLPGDVLVWREILSEGPVIFGNNESLFETRRHWLSARFGAPIEEYHQKVIAEFAKLEDVNTYAEVLLWFEFDLTCQVNLIFMLDHFYNLNTGNEITLVCPESHPNHPDFRGIGQLTPAELQALPTQKLALTREDLAFGAEAWRVYCRNDREEIENFLNRDFGQLGLLKPALAAHLNRFPDHTGLNGIDRRLMEICSSSGAVNRRELYQRFSATEKIYGMSDISVGLYLNKLEKQGLIKPVQ